MSDLVVIEHTQSITYERNHVPRENLSVSVRFTYQAFSSGWVREFLSGRGGPMDFLILAGIANHARPLRGQDLELLTNLGAATGADAGRLYARVTDAGLADELGCERRTVKTSAERLEHKGLIRTCDLPEGFRDSRGHFNGTRAYIISGIPSNYVTKEIDGKSHRGTLTATDGDESTHRGTSTATVEGQTKAHRGGSGHTNKMMKMKTKRESDQIASVLARFAGRMAGTDAAALGEHQPTVRERRQVHQLLDAGYSVEQLLEAIDQAFHSRPPHAKPIRSFGFVLSYVHRRLRPTGHPPTQAGATEGVQLVADAEHTTQTTSDPIPADPLERVYGLLDAASVHGVEDGDNVLHNTPGVRLGLRGLVGGPDACSPDEVYEAVLAALSRNVHPNRLVGYVTSILENARAEAREQERLLALSSEPRNPAPGETEPPPRRSPPLAVDDRPPQPDEEACEMWETALAELESQMTGSTFDAWIRPTSLLSWESESNGSGNPLTHIVVGAPDGYVRDWLENRLVTPVQRTLTRVAGNAVEVRFEICEPAEGQPLALLGVTDG